MIGLPPPAVWGESEYKAEGRGGGNRASRHPMSVAAAVKPEKAFAAQAGRRPPDFLVGDPANEPPPLANAYSSFSKEEAGCWQTGQVKSRGRAGPS